MVMSKFKIDVDYVVELHVIPEDQGEAVLQEVRVSDIRTTGNTLYLTSGNGQMLIVKESLGEILNKTINEAVRSSRLYLGLF